MKIGLIAREWYEWLPALHYVPVDHTWGWIQDPCWLSICSNLFPSVSFLDDNVDLLPQVDILLLSKITLSQCNLVLNQCPVSVVLSSSRLPSVKDWVHRFWRVKHVLVEGCTDGNWTVFSFCICLPFKKYIFLFCNCLRVMSNVLLRGNWFEELS